MQQFGVRFQYANAQHLDALRILYAALKSDDQSGNHRPLADWPALIPTGLSENFDWPDESVLARLKHQRETHVRVISDPAQHLSTRWDFYSLVDSIHSGEYALLGVVQCSESIAELQIDPYAYPYGGLGPLIALCEGFGFVILGVNEYGKYLTRQELRTP